MRLIRYLLQLSKRIANRTYTFIMRGSFKSWGKHSQLGRHARIDGADMVHVGNNVSLGEHIWLNVKNKSKDEKVKLRIGDGTYIGRFVQINAWHKVLIGKHVLIGDRVLISDADHKYKDKLTPIIKQGDFFKGEVRLKDGCWVGIGVVILPNVTIGQNSVVAANSVVTADVPDFTLVAGVPAQIIKQL